MDKENNINPSESSIEKKGLISEQLLKDGVSNEPLGSDHIGIEIISVKPNNLYQAVSILKKYGFNNKWLLQNYVKLFYDDFFNNFPKYNKYKI